MTASRYTSLFSRRGWKALVLLLSLSALHGCGGGGGDGGTNANPNGYYGVDGTANVNGTDITGVQGMIHDGEFVMLSDAEHLAYHGTISVSRNTFTGAVTAYENGVAVATQVPITGTISEEQFIDGRLEGAGVGSGTFRLSYSSENAVQVENSMVYHDLDWLPVNSTNNIGYVVPSDAVLATTKFSVSGKSATMFEDCKYNGQIIVIPGTHLYSITGGFVSNRCTNSIIEQIPTYNGLASLQARDSMTTDDDRLVFVISNGEYSVYGELEKQ